MSLAKYGPISQWAYGPKSQLQIGGSCMIQRAATVPTVSVCGHPQRFVVIVQSHTIPRVTRHLHNTQSITAHSCCHVRLRSPDGHDASAAGVSITPEVKLRDRRDRAGGHRGWREKNGRWGNRGGSDRPKFEDLCIWNESSTRTADNVRV